MRMWKNRREVLKAHERFTIDLFLEWFNNRHCSQFEVVDEPDPPEAVIKSGKTIRWVEVTAVFWSEAFAQDLCSYVTEGEAHKPIPDGAVLCESQRGFYPEICNSSCQKTDQKLLCGVPRHIWTWLSDRLDSVSVFRQGCNDSSWTCMG